MSSQDTPDRWAKLFGLALAPLFEDNETVVEGNHYVLLDGGYGSFAMSVVDQPIWRERTPASWSWSSNLPHHITVTKNEVAVVRWDKPDPELLTKSSVESKIDAFYEYLSADRVRSSQRVVDHMLMIFRRLRSVMADARIDDAKCTDAYLALLTLAMNASREGKPTQSIDLRQLSEGGEFLKVLSPMAMDSLVAELSATTLSRLSLDFVPALAIRHAGGEIFQEAHFELLRAPKPDLFGYAGPAESKPVTRGGTHFTPPALARSIVEQALLRLENLSARSHLAILDPACGSGAFLHEALRAIRRTKFRGKLTLIGRDTSGPAIAMATFVLKNASADWSPDGGCKIDVLRADSLDGGLPSADVILMNPPFVAWTALSSAQRQQMRDVLGPSLQGRGDLSMAFVTQALQSLAPGGVLGTLFPASLLTLQAAQEWRSSLLDQADLRFIASIGDYGLFAYALVQVAAAVFQKKGRKGQEDDDITALVTANDAETTGNALRILRREGLQPNDLTSDSWHLFQTSAKTLRGRPTWRLTSPRTETALQRLTDVGGAVPLGDLFDVRQGVRTGMNAAFLLTTNDIEQLPKKERQWFRPAVMNESVNGGLIESNHWIFYPYTRDGLAIETEAQLLKLVPTFAERFLIKSKERLEARASIVRASRSDWWGLSERRSWALDPRPRIVSKYFGGTGGFALDLTADFIVVQGFAWFPKWPPGDIDVDPKDNAAVSEILTAYAALMNSRSFSKLLEIFSPHVAGGQFDLSPRYVNAIPIPNLFLLAQDERAGHAIRALGQLARIPRVGQRDWDNAAERSTAELYGGGLIEAI